jgi:hypothetical protein
MSSRTPRRYPPIPSDLREQLMAVPPSGDTSLEYRPCRVTLTDCRVVDRVYVMEQGMYVTWWGVWPDQDHGKSSVPIDAVVRIEESPTRLPVAIANRIYEAGESGMGYCVFTLELRDGRRLPFVTGNAVDFVDLPPGVKPSDIVTVFPHEGRDHFQGRTMAPHTRGAPYAWCLYGDEPADTRSVD